VLVHAFSYRLACAAALLPIILAAPAAAQGAIRSVHGEWQLRCDTPPGAQREQCMLTQSATSDDYPRAQLRVLVFKSADLRARLMHILVPLGVQLGAGLAVKIDETDIGRAGFVRCLPNGCLAEIVLDDSLLQRWRTGQTVTLTATTGEQPIGFLLPLAGFAEGFDKLP
jgi:invasion protein IalB